MPAPIVIAHHLIWTAYGWWLPNDPRGSNSQVIRSDVIGRGHAEILMRQVESGGAQDAPE